MVSVNQSDIEGKVVELDVDVGNKNNNRPGGETVVCVLTKRGVFKMDFCCEIVLFVLYTLTYHVKNTFVGNVCVLVFSLNPRKTSESSMCINNSLFLLTGKELNDTGGEGGVVVRVHYSTFTFVL